MLPIKNMLAMAILSIFCCACSSKSHVVFNGPSGSADLTAYMKEGLPSPVPVVFDFNRSGDLVAVYGTRGENGFSAADKIAKSISIGATLKGDPVDEAMKARLGDYLKNQNISLRSLISSKSEYTLILLTPFSKDMHCGKCMYMQDEMEKAVRYQQSDKFYLSTVVLYSGTGGAGIKIVN